MLLTLPAPHKDKTGWPWQVEQATVVCAALSYPKISIVTPTYQHGHYLEETMRSVLLQDYPNLEYIVIDGGSSDETVSLLERYGEHLSYWTSEPDRGHAHAVNKGFARSTGEILAWLNAGDFYFPQALHRVAQAFQAFQEIDWLTAAQPGYYTESTGAYTYFKPGFSKSFFMAGGYLGFEPFSLGFIQQESTFWRRSLLERVNGKLNESLRLANDFELWRRFFAHADLALLDAPLGCFRSHSDQRSATQTGLYQQEAWASLGRTGHHPLSLAFRLFQKLRLHKLIEWRSLLAPFYQEKIRYISQNQTGQWQCEWRKLL